MMRFGPFFVLPGRQISAVFEAIPGLVKGAFPGEDRPVASSSGSGLCERTPATRFP